MCVRSPSASCTFELVALNKGLKFGSLNHLSNFSVSSHTDNAKLPNQITQIVLSSRCARNTHQGWAFLEKCVRKRDDMSPCRFWRFLKTLRKRFKSASFQKILRKRFKGASKALQKRFKGDSRALQRCFKGASKALQILVDFNLLLLDF